MRRRRNAAGGGAVPTAAAAKRTEEDKEEEREVVDRRRTAKRVGSLVSRGLILGAAFAFYAWCYVSLVMLPPRKLQGPLFAILGTMGCGTVAMENDLRRLGIEATHEATLGVDGVVSWLHVALYRNSTTEDLCSEFLPQAFHPQLLFVELREQCGQTDSCWKLACPRALTRWKNCATRGDCPIPFSQKPLVVVRHPLRTIESLDDFCDSAKIIAAERILGVNLSTSSSCRAQLLDYWLAFYEPFQHVSVHRREDLDGCSLVSLLAAAAEGGGGQRNTRIDFARRACSGDVGAQFWKSAYVFRQMVNRVKAEGYSGMFYDSSNSRFDRENRARIEWKDVQQDQRKRVASLAYAFGYADAEPYAR